MFQHLLESKAVATPRVGGSLVSTAGHATVVAILVALTAHQESPPREIREAALHFVPTPRVSVAASAPSTPSATARTVSSAVEPSPIIPMVLDVGEIPIGVPDISFASGGVTARDLGATGGSRVSGPLSGSELNSNSGEPFAAHEVDVPVVLAPGSPTPTYPDLLRSAAIAGGVMVEMVVDTSGRVEAGSVRIVQTDHALFSASVRAVAPRLRFLPAKAQGRNVRQLVRLPFRFSLHS